MSNLNEKLAKKVEVLDFESKPQNVILLNKQEEEAKEVSIIPDIAITINQAKERIALLQNFVQEMMIPNIDYGVIPGCQKPSLFKSGAEKLCDVYGFSKQVEVTNRLEDWEKVFFAYEVKVILTNKRTGLVEAEGIGSCNNRERKYKSQDGFTICNTIIKMAKKRALIDAVLSATRSSGIFTQDIEDMDIGPAKFKADNQITIKQIYSLAKKLNIPTEKMKKIMSERYSAPSSAELSQKQIQDLYYYLNKEYR